MEKFGCTPCHGGQGWAIDTDAAHGQVAHWEEPLLGSGLGEAYSLSADKGSLLQMNCNVCHRYDRETIETTRARELMQREVHPGGRLAGGGVFR